MTYLVDIWMPDFREKSYAGGRVWVVLREAHVGLKSNTELIRLKSSWEYNQKLKITVLCSKINLAWCILILSSLGLAG